jgi:GNAT superfamily N-acetyltransferase
MTHTLELQRADTADLPQVNRLIERAVMTWDLPERVKRLSLPSYRYDAHDLQHLQLTLAQVGSRLVGVAAWEAAAAQDLPPGKRGLLLHGLYVDPDHHRRGVGARLVQAALAAAAEQQLDGVLVKAQRDAEPFFVRQGFELLPIEDPDRHYAHRLWRPVA